MKKTFICALAASTAISAAFLVMTTCMNNKKEVGLKREMTKLYKKAKKALCELTDM